MTSSAEYTLPKEEYVKALIAIENALGSGGFFESLKPLSAEATNKLHRLVSLVLDGTATDEAIQKILSNG